MSSIESSTISAVTLALDVATLRHKAHAANIANAGTPGYQPVRVSFEEQLGALRATLQRTGRIDASLLAGAQPQIEREPVVMAGPGGTQVAIDAEVAKIAENQVHYQALLRALNKQLSILAIAINDGKR